MADKLSALVLDALTRAAADPAGVPLYATKSEPGLFPPTSAAKPAAKKCLDDGLLRVVGPDPKGKPGRELCAVTEKGLQRLVEEASPRQVLEDFVRVLEARQTQTDELLATARQMADSLAGLRSAVAAVLPQVQAGRVAGTCEPRPPGSGVNGPPLPGGRGSSRFDSEGSLMPAVATLPAAVAVADPLDDLAGAVLAHLADWAASAGAAQDCPLPELFRALSVRSDPPTIGAFHDCLRHLHAARRVYLHPWTGPLYALPEPPLALLVGHEVAYYASVR